MTDFIDWLLHIAQRNPDLVALILGTASGYGLGTLAEAYLIPLTMIPRKQKGLTALITIVASWCLSYAIWGALDVGDKPELRAIVSAAASILSVFTYPAVGRWVTARFPSVGSIWAVQS